MGSSGVRGWGTHPSARCCSQKRVSPAPTRCVPGLLCQPGSSRVPGAGKGDFNSPKCHVEGRGRSGGLSSHPWKRRRACWRIPAASPAPQGFRDGRHCRSDEHGRPTPQARDMGFIRQVFLAAGQLSQHTAKPQPHTRLLRGPPLPGERTAARMTTAAHAGGFWELLLKPARGMAAPKSRSARGSNPPAQRLAGGDQSALDPAQGHRLPPRALYSLLGKQIEGEDATWLFLRNIDSLVRKELKSNTPTVSVPAQGSSGQGAVSPSC